MLLKTIITAVFLSSSFVVSSMSAKGLYLPQVPISLTHTPMIGFGDSWSVIGPFQIGTREPAWGADPLEYYGGFPCLQPHNDEIFKSSLAPNGTATWSTTRARATETTDQVSKVALTIAFPDVDWTVLQSVYGWSALQWQAWARGEIVVSSDEPVDALLYTDHVLEYALDGARHFGGDFYAFRKAPLVVRLTPGKHVLDLRLVRDVRAMGGVGQPSIDVDIEIRLATADVELEDKKILVSDVVDRVLPSPYGSVDIRNSGQNWIEVFKIAPAQPEAVALTVELFEDNTRAVAPGQTRPIIFLLQLSDRVKPLSTDFELIVSYRHKNNHKNIGSLKVNVQLNHKSRYEPHKVTHLHPGGIVSYAILRAPSANATCRGSDSAFKVPVMLQLHGAGLEADSDLVAHALDSLPDLCAWVLFATGVTPWSADDWHAWGFADIQAAIENIPSWIETTNWAGFDVDADKWFVGGHSNGGQGTWYTLLHWPDKVFAASPISGYLSIQEYVPYKFWKPTEPKKRAVVEAATNSYRHEILVPNAKGIPIQQQHGSADDNVPVYHSRLMSELLAESGWPSNYSEVTGQGHWWDGVVTTDVLATFYKEQLGSSHKKREIPHSFEVIVANPADMGSKFGLKVLYLIEPGELGKVVATRDESSNQWSLETHNILSFQWERQIFGSSIIIDRVEVDWKQDLEELSVKIVELWRDDNGHWTTMKPSNTMRHPRHFGGLEAILRTKGHFTITYHGNNTLPVALQVSRNLHQYLYADAVLVEGEATATSTGNKITLSVGHQVPSHICTSDFPISICASNDGTDSTFTLSLLARHTLNPRAKIYSGESEVAAIFLRPSDGRLELVLWGSTTRMLAQVARLVPMMTGTGQPDFIVMDRSAAWRGVDGCALGFFDARWEVSSMSSLNLESRASER